MRVQLLQAEHNFGKMDFSAETMSFGATQKGKKRREEKKEKQKLNAK